MKAPKIVQAPEGCEDYLTAGKNYNVTGLWRSNYSESLGFRFNIMCDDSMEIGCLENNCSHANGNWIIIERES